MNKVFLFLRTILHLKIRQIFYQILFRFKKLFFHPFCHYNKYLTYEVAELNVTYYPTISSTVRLKENTFSFLNKTKTFQSEIDWKFNEYGKLWTYNLQYADCLLDENLSLNERLIYIQSLTNAIFNKEIGLEAYPVSIRLINTILFLTRNKLKDKQLIDVVKKQISFLENNIEYHIDANHLFENWIALSISSRFIQVKSLITKSDKEVIACCNEQILKDGGHYERSLMYHSMIFQRLLCLYGLLGDSEKLKPYLKLKLTSMAEYLFTMSDGGQYFPCFNDAVFDENLAPSRLLDSARKVGITSDFCMLGDSGYRLFKNEYFFLVANLGGVICNYQPGHIHADSLSFILYLHGKKMIVDTGISTYESNERRILERSTVSHNTVTILNKNQSEIWSAFRMANRSKIEMINDQMNFFEAKLHFSSDDIQHKRRFELDNQEIIISDHVKCEGNEEAVFNLHFDSNCKIELISENSFKVDNLTFHCTGALKISQSQYQLAIGFNSWVAAPIIQIHFRRQLITRMYV